MSIVPPQGSAVLRAPPEAGLAIALVGAALAPAHRRRLVDAGLRIGPAARAALRVHVGNRPPARPPAAPWLWCSPRPIDPADAAAAVLAGAYDVMEVGDGLAAAIAR